MEAISAQAVEESTSQRSRWQGRSRPPVSHQRWQATASARNPL